MSRDEQALAARLAALAEAEGGAMQDSVPERWWQDPTWRCTNGHVSKRFGPGRRRRRVCVFKFCDSLVLLTFPEDRSGPLQ